MTNYSRGDANYTAALVEYFIEDQLPIVLGNGVVKAGLEMSPLVQPVCRQPSGGQELDGCASLPDGIDLINFYRT